MLLQVTNSTTNRRLMTHQTDREAADERCNDDGQDLAALEAIVGWIRLDSVTRWEGLKSATSLNQSAKQPKRSPCADGEKLLTVYFPAAMRCAP